MKIGFNQIVLSGLLLVSSSVVRAQLKSPISAKENIPLFSGYRVILTPPKHFVYALKESPATSPTGGAAHSRLSKFYKIRNKTLRGNTITIEFLPRVPYVTDWLPYSQVIKVKLVEKKVQPEKYLYDAYFETQGKNYVKTLLEIDQHKSGSLLKLSLVESSYSPSVVKFFANVANALGFVSKSAKEAEQNLSQ